MLATDSRLQHPICVSGDIKLSKSGCVWPKTICCLAWKHKTLWIWERKYVPQSMPPWDHTRRVTSATVALTDILSGKWSQWNAAINHEQDGSAWSTKPGNLQQGQDGLKWHKTCLTKTDLGPRLVYSYIYHWRNVSRGIRRNPHHGGHVAGTAAAVLSRLTSCRKTRPAYPSKRS